MKKLTYAIALSTLLLAGCSQEDGIMESKGELVTLNYNISLTDGVQSRAGEGVDHGVNKLLCMVFEKDSTEVLKRQVVDFDNEGKAQYTPVLFKNIKYRIVFWAYHKNGNDSCYNVTNKAIVTTNEKYDMECFANDLHKNAYSAYDDVQIIDNAMSIKVILTRPFGQINVYTTEQDWKNALGLQSIPSSSSLTLSGFSTQFNALNQEWVDEGCEAFELNSTVSYENNYCLASEYVFANGNGNCQIKVKDQNPNPKEIYNYTVSNFPIGKNQRTNIKPADGSVGLMTGNVSYIIEISNGFDTTNENNKTIN